MKYVSQRIQLRSITRRPLPRRSSKAAHCGRTRFVLRPEAFLKHSRHRPLHDLLSSPRDDSRFACSCVVKFFSLHSLCTVIVIRPIKSLHKHVRRAHVRTAVAYQLVPKRKKKSKLFGELPGYLSNAGKRRPKGWLF